MSPFEARYSAWSVRSITCLAALWRSGLRSELRQRPLRVSSVACALPPRQNSRHPLSSVLRTKQFGMFSKGFRPICSPNPARVLFFLHHAFGGNTFHRNVLINM